MVEAGGGIIELEAGMVKDAKLKPTGRALYCSGVRRGPNMNSGSEWKWRLLDVFAQSKDDVEMWVGAPGRSLSSPPKPSLNDPSGNAPKHHGRKNPFSLWRSDTECAAGQAARLTDCQALSRKACREATTPLGALLAVAIKSY